MNKILVLVLVCLAVVFAKPQKPQTDCDICKTLIQAIEGWMEQNKTVSQIEKDLDTVCQLAPAFDSVCETFVSWGVPEIVDWIETNEDPATVCSQMFICLAKKPKARQGDCYMCTYVIQSMESWLEQNATINEIESYLDQLCTLVPDLDAQCEAIVNTGVPKVVSWIEANESPTDVCTQLGFCGNSTRVKAMKAKAEAKARQDQCFICETVISTVEQWVASNATEQEIEQYLDTLCTLVPSFQAQCDAIVATGVAKIVQWIEQNQTPQQICTNLGMCNSTMPMIPKPPQSRPVINKNHRAGFLKIKF
jgi:saposin